MRDLPDIDDAAESRAAETLFFSQLDTDDSPGSVAQRSYLLLLHGQAIELNDAILGMRTTLARVPRPEFERDTNSLLRATNWRFHNIACLALLSRRAPKEIIGELWLALARGSWTSPQLAATAALIDTEFKQKALALIGQKSTYYKSILSLTALLNPEGEAPRLETSIEANVEEARTIDFDDTMKLALDRYNEFKAVARCGLTPRSS